MNEGEPNLYELYYTLTAPSPEDASGVVSVLLSYIEKEHGIVASQAQPTARILAYPIGAEREAHTGWIRFMMKSEGMVKLQEQLRAEKKLLRFMLTHAKKDDMAIEPRRRKRITATAPETQAKTEEIDKKLEEILGA